MRALLVGLAMVGLTIGAAEARGGQGGVIRRMGGHGHGFHQGGGFHHGFGGHFGGYRGDHRSYGFHRGFGGYSYGNPSWHPRRCFIRFGPFGPYRVCRWRPY